MIETLTNLFDLEPNIARGAGYIVTLALVLATIILIAAVFRLVKNISTRVIVNKNGSRLSVITSVMIDAKRRLLVIRCDNKEHLLLVGGPADIVVENNIRGKNEIFSSYSSSGNNTSPMKLSQKIALERQKLADEHTQNHNEDDTITPEENTTHSGKWPFQRLYNVLQSGRKGDMHTGKENISAEQKLITEDELTSMNNIAQEIIRQNARYEQEDNLPPSEIEPHIDNDPRQSLVEAVRQGIDLDQDETPIAEQKEEQETHSNQEVEVNPPTGDISENEAIESQDSNHDVYAAIRRELMGKNPQMEDVSTEPSTDFAKAEEIAETSLAQATVEGTDTAISETKVSNDISPSPDFVETIEPLALNGDTPSIEISQDDDEIPLDTTTAQQESTNEEKQKTQPSSEIDENASENTDDMIIINIEPNQDEISEARQHENTQANKQHEDESDEINNTLHQAVDETVVKSDEEFEMEMSRLLNELSEIHKLDKKTVAL